MEATADELLQVLLRRWDGSDCLRHVAEMPARPPVRRPWPSWVPPEVVASFGAAGICDLYPHQEQALDMLGGGQDLAIATGTGSGKSLVYLVPIASAVARAHAEAAGRPLLGRRNEPTALYISPTKALAHDQLRRVHELALPGMRAAAYDGDTPPEDRSWARRHANLVVTNPDMLHRGILPGHPNWAGFLRGLQFVVVDEFHSYRGVFGAHLAAVLRRLLRLAQHYGGEPQVIGASATVGQPASTVSALTGRPCGEVVADLAPRGRALLALWEPPGQGDGPRPGLVPHTAELVADLVAKDVRTLAFVRSRRGAESLARLVRSRLAERGDPRAGRFAPYRSGYLPEERRALEADLQQGRLLGLAATSALELGIDVAGLDAVVIAGWPGTRASLRQRIGRAGRSGGEALAVFVADDDPLDAYLVRHPELALQGAEAVVLDPQNPYVLAPHLCCAAAELPLTDADAAASFGAGALDLLALLQQRGALRRRSSAWYWTGRASPADLADLRGTGGSPFSVVEEGTGRLIATVDPGAAHRTIHPGAVYTHLGVDHVITDLDLEQRVAIASARPVPFSTIALTVGGTSVVSRERSADWGPVQAAWGTVEVTSRVVGFLRRRTNSGEVLGQESLDLPEQTLRTRAVWYTVADELLRTAGVDDVAGAAHAAEHAAIALLPLLAQCDRWDLGGLSTDRHPDTGMCTVFVHDGQPGGAGFAERGYADLRVWLTTTRDAIDDCPCQAGCPACVQSPKCGNGNNPLDKAGAVRLLSAVVAAAAAAGGATV